MELRGVVKYSLSPLSPLSPCTGSTAASGTPRQHGRR
jgi:hypothetical protein